jgi:hypothetical protein
MFAGSKMSQYKAIKRLVARFVRPVKFLRARDYHEYTLIMTVWRNEVSWAKKYLCGEGALSASVLLGEMSVRPNMRTVLAVADAVSKDLQHAIIALTAYKSNKMGLAEKLIFRVAYCDYDGELNDTPMNTAFARAMHQRGVVGLLYRPMYYQSHWS